MIENKNLRVWQQRAYCKWAIANSNGILLGCTGSGKSIAALYCIQERKAKSLIVVPTIALMNQWIDEISKHLDIEKKDIGMIGDGNDSIKKITICVVNSIRNRDLSYFDMIVLDEAHRYGSEENIKPILKNKFKYKLGITATLKREDGKDTELIKLIGPVVYTYHTIDAVRDGVLSNFDIVNVGVELQDHERTNYDIYTKTITECGFSNMFEVARDRMHPGRYKALRAVGAISKRKALINNAEGKLITLLDIIKKEQGKKIIVFNETIKLATVEKKLLKKEGIESEIYHSKMKEQDAIDRFKSGESKILISVKSLNEGLDVKDVDVCIRVAGNSQDRDTIQRLGRGLRVVEGKGKAKYYQIYCKDTVELTHITKNTKVIEEAADNVMWI